MAATCLKHDPPCAGQQKGGSAMIFTVGVDDKNAAICIPYSTASQQSGYYEDRRPASNMDPYLVTTMLAATTLGLPIPGVALTCPASACCHALPVTRSYAAHWTVSSAWLTAWLSLHLAMQAWPALPLSCPHRPDQPPAAAAPNPSRPPAARAL